MPKKRNKKTNPFRWSTQGGDFNTNFTSNVEFLPHRLYKRKIVMCNFRMDDLEVHHRYDMILLLDIFYELNIDLCFSEKTTRLYGSAYKVFTVPMKDVSKIKFNLLSDWLKY